MKPPPDLSNDEERILQRLLERQHETEDAESRLLQRFGSRAALAKQLWTAVAGAVIVLSAGLLFVFTVKSDVERSAKDIQQMRTDLQQARAETQTLSDRVQSIRLELKDKADRK